MKTTWSKAAQRRHRQAWVKALREGGYKQTRGQLRNRAGAMCCLGVACEISKLGKWVKRENGVVGYEVRGGGRHESNLPSVVCAYYGLSDILGGFWSGLYNFTTLADMNDMEKRRFRTIADLIESEPEGLVKK